MSRRRLGLVAALLASTTVACTRDVRLLPTGAGGAAGLGAGTGAAGTGGHAGASASAGSSGATCAGQGPSILFPTAATTTCASALAARGHRYAVCSCDVTNVPARIRTDAFDSTGAGAPDETSAAVGVNGLLQTSAELRAGGAIVVAGNVLAADHLQSAGALRVGGNLELSSSNADVGGDAFVGGDVSGNVRVNGTLHTAAASSIGGNVQAAGLTREAIAVPAPCACGLDFVDLGAALAVAVAAYAGAPAGLRPDALANVTSPARLDVNCGTVLLSSIAAQAEVTLAVHGRALLVVTGDVALRGGLAVTLDAGAELDLLVGGHFSTSGANAAIGTTTAPARFRIWVSSTGTLALDDGPTVGAILHAPGAIVSAPAGLSLYGSVLARSIAFGGEAGVHFDRAVLSAGAACGEPAQPPPS